MEQYPENLIRAIGVPLVCNTDVYVPLTAEQLTDMEDKIASQDDMHRDALLLHYQDGLTYKETADRLGLVSLASAYSIVHTTLGRIRRMYEGKKPRRSSPRIDEAGVEISAHERAVVRNNTVVRMEEGGAATYQGFDAPTAVSYFHVSVDHMTPVAGQAAPVDNEQKEGTTT